MTSVSTLPKISRRIGARSSVNTSVTSVEIATTVSTSWRPVSTASSRSLRPRYWAQMIVPPVAMAAKTLIISTLMASTSDTAEIAAEPALDTIIVSAVPISELSSCSIISGISRLQICRFVNNGAPGCTERAARRDLFVSKAVYLCLS